GAWTRAVGPLACAPDAVQAWAVDAAGNTSPGSTTITFTVDTTAPPAPVVSAPVSGSLTASGSLTVQGTAEPNSTVRLEMDSELAVGRASGRCGARRLGG